MRMERNDIQINLEEHERWAAETLKGVKEEHLFASSKLSDAAFLVSLRDRLSARSTAAYRRVFPSFRTVGAMASACVILLVAVIAGGRFSETFAPKEMLQNGLTDVATAPTEMIVDSLAEAQIDPVELAAYLDVPEFVEEDVADAIEDLPLTDQLLALDMGTLEEVLTDLEDTEFF